MESATKYDVLCDDIKALIQISEEDFKILNKNRDFFLENANVLLDFILKVLISHPTTNAVFTEKRGDSSKLGVSVGKWLIGILDAHDKPEVWRQQYKIGLEHIRRKIPNRHMMGLATRIREFVLPVMLSSLGQEAGLELYISFQRFLDTIVALTATLVDEGQKQALMRSTGFTEVLIERLQAIVFKEIEAEIMSSL